MLIHILGTGSVPLGAVPKQECRRSSWDIEKITTEVMYSALFPAPPHLLLRKPPGEVQYKLKNRPGTLIPGVGEEVQSSRSSYAERFALHTQPDSVGNNKNL